MLKIMDDLLLYKNLAIYNDVTLTKTELSIG